MEKVSETRLMIIGASWEQVPLIRTAKEMGCYVMATDPNPEAEGFSVADEHALLDPRNLRKAMKLAELYKPDGITADQCDYSHYAAVYLSTRLGLPNDGLPAAQYSTNKLWMRERCLEAHILQPRFLCCRTFEDACKAVDLIGWPVILKPVDNRGASGVNVACSEEELKKAYLDALMYSHSREIIVEAYIEGTHITVDGCVDQGGFHHNLAYATKQVTAGDKPIITQVDYPGRITWEYRDQILDVNSQVVEALDIQRGLTHSEYILDQKGRCFLVETANRGGGVLTSSHIVPKISGVDLSRLLVSNALGNRYPVHPTSDSGRVTLRFFLFKPGKVLGIEGIDDTKTLEGVEYLRLLFNPGDVLETPQSGAERHGFAILRADNDEGIENVYNEMLNTIKVEYEQD